MLPLGGTFRFKLAGLVVLSIHKQWPMSRKTSVFWLRKLILQKQGASCHADSSRDAARPLNGRRMTCPEGDWLIRRSEAPILSQLCCCITYGISPVSCQIHTLRVKGVSPDTPNTGNDAAPLIYHVPLEGRKTPISVVPSPS